MKNKLFIIPLAITITLILVLLYLTIYSSNSRKELNQLKNNYSPEVINYVYNSVFEPRKGFKSVRWNHDILLSAQGELWENDSLYIENAIEQINDLNLGFSIQWTDNYAKSDINIYFGDTLALNKYNIGDYNFVGKSIISFNQNSILILINNSATFYSKYQQLNVLTRKGTILHEILHSLGFLKDNIDDPESILYYSRGFNTKLSTRDKEALQFWYNPFFHSSYSKSNFESDFKDVLHCIDTKAKIITYCLENDVKLDVLYHIKEYSFDNVNTELQKFPGILFISLNTDINETGFIELKSVMNYLNDNVNYLVLQFRDFEPFPEVPVINIEMNEDNTISTKGQIQSRTFKVTITNLETLAIGELITNYKDKSVLVKPFTEELFLISIASILGINTFDKEITQVDSLNNVILKPKYLTILNLVYNPVIPYGMKLEDFQEVIDELEIIGKQKLALAS